MEKRLAQKNSECVDMKQKYDSVARDFHQTESKLKSELENVKILQYEKECALKKSEEIVLQTTSDNSGHINMYKEYENKIEQLNGDLNHMKLETENLSKALKEKSDQNKQLHKELKELKLSLDRAVEEKCDISERCNKLCEDISNMDDDRVKLEENLDELKKELFSNSEEAQSKIVHLAEEKNKADYFINELRLCKSALQEELDKMNREILLRSNDDKQKLVELSTSLELGKSQYETVEKDNQMLLMELEYSRKEIQLRKEERVDEEALLLGMSQDLKEKNSDLTVLQDQKADLLNVIAQLKKEMSSKSEHVKDSQMEIVETLKVRDAAIQDLMDEKLVFTNEFSQLRKQLIDIEKRNADIEFELVEKNRSLSHFIEEQRNDHGRKLMDHDVLEEKNRQIAVIQEAYTSVKKQLEDLAKLKSDESTGDEICQVQRVNLDFQMANVSNDDSVVVEEMQSHIDKLRNEILSLQGKYFDLKNGAPVSNLVHFIHIYTYLFIPIHVTIAIYVCLS